MTNTKKKSTGLNVTLWIVQGLLAASLFWAGGVKLMSSPDELAAMWPWTIEHRTLVMLTGVVDLLAGIGLILPMALGVKPHLTVYAAYGVVVLMIVASVFHITRGEADSIGVNVVFGVMAAFVAWGRTR